MLTHMMLLTAIVTEVAIVTCTDALLRTTYIIYCPLIGSKSHVVFVSVFMNTGCLGCVDLPKIRAVCLRCVLRNGTIRRTQQHAEVRQLATKGFSISTQSLVYALAPTHLCHTPLFTD